MKWTTFMIFSTLLKQDDLRDFWNKTSYKKDEGKKKAKYLVERTNIWNKVKKYSQAAQDWETLIWAFEYFLTAIPKV